MLQYFISIRDSLTIVLISERIKRLEMDCLDLLQPMGSAIVLEKQLEKLKEIESKLMQKFKEFKNN